MQSWFWRKYTVVVLAAVQYLRWYSDGTCDGTVVVLAVVQLRYWRCGTQVVLAVVHWWYWRWYTDCSGSGTVVLLPWRRYSGSTGGMVRWWCWRWYIGATGGGYTGILLVHDVHLIVLCSTAMWYKNGGHRCSCMAEKQKNCYNFMMPYRGIGHNSVNCVPVLANFICAVINYQETIYF